MFFDLISEMYLDWYSVYSFLKLNYFSLFFLKDYLLELRGMEYLENLQVLKVVWQVAMAVDQVSRPMITKVMIKPNQSFRFVFY